MSAQVFSLMLSKNYQIVTDSWRCSKCEKGKEETTFAVRVNKNSTRYVSKMCNKCREKKALYRKNKCKSYRIEISNKFKEYWRQNEK